MVSRFAYPLKLGQIKKINSTQHMMFRLFPISCGDPQLAQKSTYASFLLWLGELLSNLPPGLAYLEIIRQI